MTDIGEAVAVAIGGLEAELTKNCPFKVEAESVSEEDPEGVAKDDTAAAQEEQANNGGTLGKNLESASPGKSATLGGPFAPPKADEDPRIDTRRAGVKSFIKGTTTIADGNWPFTVAAHHLIPGEASLAPSELKQKFMTKGGSATVNGHTWTMKEHIGYNVNGAHNGVWLPGNYAIRSKDSPIANQSWSEIVGPHEDWCLHYVAGVTKIANGQFHDTHTEYSASVQDLLNKIACVLIEHQTVCEECEGKTEVPPPYSIKNRLYALSRYLKTKARGELATWKKPWVTSDQWARIILGNSTSRGRYESAYTYAKSVPSP